MVSLLRSRTKTTPAFYRGELEFALEGEPERLERALNDPENVDLLTWNVFASLDTHPDRDYLAYRLQSLGGATLRAPVRLSLWSGRTREPRLQPSPAYLTHLRARTRGAGGEDDLSDFAARIEVPVRIESPDVLCLVETSLGDLRRGAGGRDRLVELIDAGLDHARRLDRSLAVAVVYRSGTEAAKALSARVNELRDPSKLAAALPWRESMPPVVLREVSWQQLLKIWEQESDYLRLGGQPVKAFLAHARTLGLR